MSRFHESVREILEDIHGFLTDTLNHESLASSTIAEKEKVVKKLEDISQQYPQLQLEFGVSTAPTPPEQKPCLSSTNRPSSSPPPIPTSPPGLPLSPPPYVDMRGKKVDIMALKKTEETYESCSSEKSFDSSLSGDGQTGWNYPLIPATDTHKFSKYGFLDKKRKERLGGLIKSTQQRFYAIKDDFLYYYDRPSDQVPKGAISLQGYEVRPSYGKENRNSSCFELVCPGKRTYQFSALTSVDMKQWISAFEHSNGLDQYTSDNLTNRISDYMTPSSFQVPLEDMYELVDDKESSCSPGTDSESTEPKKTKDFASPDPYSSAFNYEDLYIGLWDCKADEDNELQFQRGDVIRIINREYDSYSWWVGTLNGKVGFVPKSYLMEAYHSY